MKTKVYPVRQAVWGADHCYTYYFRNMEERDHYMSAHNYCDALRARTMEMEEHEFYYIAGTYEKNDNWGY